MNIFEKIDVKSERIGKSKLTSGDKFKITAEYNNKIIDFNFNDNYYNSSKKADYLEAIILDSEAYEEAQSDFLYFAKLYGYNDIEEAEKIYFGCEENHKKVNYLFNKKEIEKLKKELEKYI